MLEDDPKSVLPDSGYLLVQNYAKRCDELGRSRDPDLMERFRPVLSAGLGIQL